MLTSKRKSSKKKSAAAGIACGREGGKGEPKSGPFGALKRKSPPPFPPRSGCGNDGKPYRVYHIPTASAHPSFPLRLSPYPREKFKRFFNLPKGKRGAYIINIFISLFFDNQNSDLISASPWPVYTAYIINIFISLFLIVIIACPGELFKSPGQASSLLALSPLERLPTA
jgi:hypothetical protein